MDEIDIGGNCYEAKGFQQVGLQLHTFFPLTAYWEDAVALPSPYMLPIICSNLSSQSIFCNTSSWIAAAILFSPQFLTYCSNVVLTLKKVQWVVRSQSDTLQCTEYRALHTSSTERQKSAPQAYFFQSHVIIWRGHEDVNFFFITRVSPEVQTSG